MPSHHRTSHHSLHHHHHRDDEDDRPRRHRPEHQSSDGHQRKYKYTTSSTLSNNNNRRRESPPRRSYSRSSSSGSSYTYSSSVSTQSSSFSSGSATTTSSLCSTCGSSHHHQSPRRSSESYRTGKTKSYANSIGNTKNIVVSGKNERKRGNAEIETKRREKEKKYIFVETSPKAKDSVGKRGTKIVEVGSLDKIVATSSTHQNAQKKNKKASDLARHQEETSDHFVRGSSARGRQPQPQQEKELVLRSGPNQPLKDALIALMETQRHASFLLAEAKKRAMERQDSAPKPLAVHVYHHHDASTISTEQASSPGDKGAKEEGERSSTRQMQTKGEIGIHHGPSGAFVPLDPVSHLDVQNNENPPNRHGAPQGNNRAGGTALPVKSPTPTPSMVSIRTEADSNAGVQPTQRKGHVTGGTPLPLTSRTGSSGKIAPPKNRPQPSDVSSIQSIRTIE